MAHTDERYPGVTIDAHPLGAMVDDKGWQHRAYRVTVRYQGREMEVTFRMGMGLHGAPSADDVMESLCSDAASIVNAPAFEEWAAEFGFDTDSRRAYATWEAVRDQTDRLRVLLGAEFDAFVFPDAS